MVKKPSFPFFFKKLNKKSTGVKHSTGDIDATSADAGASTSGGGRWSFKNLSSGMRWKRKFSLYEWFVDVFIFKIVSVLEATVLVLTFCAFFLCCGCHI